MTPLPISNVQVCVAVEAAMKHVYEKDALAFLRQLTQESPWVCRYAIFEARGHGLLEYAFSEGRSWLTKRGKDYLAKVRRDAALEDLALSDAKRAAENQRERMVA